MDIRDIAVDFLKISATKNVREAFDRYVAGGFVHHNAFFHSDAASLLKGMIESAEQYPEKPINIIHVISENETVAIHSHIRLHELHAGFAMMHIFRFKNGKIVEMWDFGQQVPDTVINELGMF